MFSEVVFDSERSTYIHQQAYEGDETPIKYLWYNAREFVAFKEEAFLHDARFVAKEAKAKATD